MHQYVIAQALIVALLQVWAEIPKTQSGACPDDVVAAYMQFGTIHSIELPDEFLRYTHESWRSL